MKCCFEVVCTTAREGGQPALHNHWRGEEAGGSEGREEGETLRRASEGVREESRERCNQEQARVS